MELSLLMLTLGILGASAYALTNRTSSQGAAISGVVGAISGYIVDAKTAFTDLVWNAAVVDHNGYAIFFLVGLLSLALVMATNLTLTGGRAAVR